MTLRLDVVTVERQVFSADDIDMVIVPGTEGVMGILPRHEPVVTGLREGALEILRGGDRELLAIGGGFMEVRDSRVIVMADRAEQADEIDAERAEEARQRAEKALAEADVKEDRERALAALQRAQTRLQVSQRARRRRREGARRD